MTVTVLVGDCRSLLAEMAPESVHVVVTSPPYWGLRDYSIAPQVWGGNLACSHDWGEPIRVHKGGPHGQGVMLTGDRAVVSAQAKTKDIDAGAFCRLCGAWRGSLGLEPYPSLYVEHMVSVFREIRRVLRRDGTLWLNLGDSYISSGGPRFRRVAGKAGYRLAEGERDNGPHRAPGSATRSIGNRGTGLKPKDLALIPSRVAIALQEDGWWVRQDVVWSKPTPMPESTVDRPTSSHEYVFLLSRREHYYYDAVAIAEAASTEAHPRRARRVPMKADPGDAPAPTRSNGKTRATPAKKAAPGDEELIRANERFYRHTGEVLPLRNKRSVWTIPTERFPEAHFATFPPALVEPCIRAGSSEHGVCPVCGAPWRRVVAKLSDKRSNAAQAGTEIAGKGHATTQVRAGHDIRDGPVVLTATVGWRRGCRCEGAGEPVPATVLDPFGGSGTTGMVAYRLDRQAVLIELSPTYAEMARKRIAEDVGFLAGNLPADGKTSGTGSQSTFWK